MLDYISLVKRKYGYIWYPGPSSEETEPRAKSLRPGSCVQDLNSNVADKKDLTSYY